MFPLIYARSHFLRRSQKVITGRFDKLTNWVRLNRIELIRYVGVGKIYNIIIKKSKTEKQNSLDNERRVKETKRIVHKDKRGISNTTGILSTR